jgi:hypothetical protein
MPATAAASATNTDSKAAAPQLLVPFSRAAREHTETFYDSGSLSAGADFGPVDIPAYGFLRSLLLDVQVTSTGNSATVALHEDAPYNALSNLLVQDVNSTPVYGPLDGFSAYCADRYLGIRGPLDPRLVPGGYTQFTTGAGATAGSGRFTIRIPIEAIARTGLGSLANANSSTTYKLRGTLNSLANIFTTVPNGTVVFRVKATLEAWSVPAAQDWRGRAQEQVPPGNGTTAYVSRTVFSSVATGANTLRLPRVGNYIRSLVLIFRSGTGSTARSTGESSGLPDPTNLYIDTRLMHQQSPNVSRRYEAERMRNTSTTFDGAGGPTNGVIVFDGCHDYGQIGNENGDQWLPTLQSTRAELQFTSAFSGSLTVITHDVAPPASASM